MRYYSVEDIVKLFRKLEYITYTPSGKFYEFRLPDGKMTNCQDWNLPVRIIELLGGEE